MFDQQDYYSDEQIEDQKKSKIIQKSQIPSSGMEFNHLTGQGQSLLKMMKDRGFDLTENEVKKFKDHKEYKSKQKESSKVKNKAGFFDGGNSATLQQLMKALKKSFSMADPQQANCILSYILQKKNLSTEDRDKFSIMKGNLLFGLGAYQECINKVQLYLEKTQDKLSMAIYSNLLAKCKLQNNLILIGYYDLLRAKSLIEIYKDQFQNIKQQDKQQFGDSNVDIIIRQVNHTQLEYNIKMIQYKNNTNLIYPHFLQFRHRSIKFVSCGDFHALFLTGLPLITDLKVQNSDQAWTNQVFGIGENTVGQILGRSTQNIFKQPILISDLSGKSISGIWATKQTSLAYDSLGNIYQWGIKQQRNEKINITYSLGDKIKHLQKGYKHYAALTISNSFYTWGTIQYKGVDLINKKKPQIHTVNNISQFSCGNNYIIVLQKNGQGYALGDNQCGQLGIQQELFTKQFKIINKNKLMGLLQKVYCIGDCTFFVNTDHQVYFCGKYSYNSIQFYYILENNLHKVRQAEFHGDPTNIISIAGTISNYYITDATGRLYRWNVDQTVKFKQQNQQKVNQRYISNSRGMIFKMKGFVQPNYCKLQRVTKSLKTYQDINYNLILKDKYGLFGNQLILPIHCQIYLSTYQVKQAQIYSQNKSYLDNINDGSSSNYLQINQIVQSRLLSYNLTRNQDMPWICNLIFQVDKAGKYFLYVLLQEKMLHKQQIIIQVSEREKQLQEKNKLDNQLKQQQRRLKMEQKKQKLLQQKLRKEEQEQQRKRQTQRRAEQALKKHMKQQQQDRIRLQQERKRRQQLQTGGGFDLSKLKRKNSMEKSGQSFLPDINIRPSSKRKIGLPRPSQLITQIQKSKQIMINDAPTSATLSNGFKSQKPKPKLVDNFTNVGSTTMTTTGRTLIKRGSSKNKK